MRFGLSWCFILALLSFQPAAAEPAPEPPEQTTAPQQIDAALVKQLGDWTAEAMQLHPARKPLTVIASSEKYVQALRVRARHNSESRFILLPGTMIFDTDAVDADNPVIRSQIVHAQAHYLQLLNKRPYECAEMQEFEAFTLQNRWLEEQGERTYISPRTLARWEHCPVAEETPLAAAAPVPEPVPLPDDAAAADE